MRLVHERGVSLNLPHEREELKKADISVCRKYISRSLTGLFRPFSVALTVSLLDELLSILDDDSLVFLAYTLACEVVNRSLLVQRAVADFRNA